MTNKDGGQSLAGSQEVDDMKLMCCGRWEAEQEATRQQRFGRSHFAQHHFGGDMSGVKR